MNLKRLRRSIAFFLVLTAMTALLAGCDSGRSEMLDELVEMEGGPEEVSPERIEELKSQINEYRDIVEEKVQAAGELGVYYKMLGRAYMDRKMYGLALESFEEAIRIETDNPVAFYFAGAAAGHMAKAAGTEEEALAAYEKAERYYRRAVELDPDYYDALYGLAVLYAFELDRPEEALSLLERANEAKPARARAYMLKGRVLLELGRPEEAAAAYGIAAERAASKELRDAAIENRRRVLGETEG